MTGEILDFAGQPEHLFRYAGTCIPVLLAFVIGYFGRHRGATGEGPNSICFDQASTWPWEAPRALPMSRTAERGR